MKKVLAIIIFGLVVSGCTDYEINVNVLTPPDEDAVSASCKYEGDIDVKIYITGNNDADNLKGTDDIEAKLK